jgi:hypothetical protein
LKPIETHYLGCRFRSRLEARWAVFFEALGIKWWYEPEGFSLRYDYKEFVANRAILLEMTGDEPLYEILRQTFKHLDGKEYSYLPDFYLPELNYWIEVKGPNPNREEIEKAFMLNQLALNSSKEKGGIFGYSGFDSGSVALALLRMAKAGAEEPPIKEPEYRGLLRGSLRLCWQECPLCLKVGIGKIGEPFCRNCHDGVAAHLANYLAARHPVISEVGTKALGLSKDLMNPEFFASGHKSPRLQQAYREARSARFEHGESP